MVGMPLAVPKPRACWSSMPGTTTAGETAAMTKPGVPPGRPNGLLALGWWWHRVLPLRVRATAALLRSACSSQSLSLAS